MNDSFEIQGTAADSDIGLADERVQGRGDFDRGHWSRLDSRRLWLLALLSRAAAAIVPLGWNYLQSYQSTDDALFDSLQLVRRNFAIRLWFVRADSQIVTFVAIGNSRFVIR
jgi:hypothetical protein